MIKLCIFVAGLAGATPGFADIEDPCADLWFSRNAMLDRAGYCFTSPLGKAIFDNRDCTTKTPVPSPEARQQIAIIRDLERGDADGFYAACNIDTTTDSLDLAAIPLRQQLEFQPATDGGTGICFGYLGPDIPIYAAPWENAHRIGDIKAGDSITFNHLDWNGWSFSLIGQQDGWRAAGWHKAALGGDSCEAFAG